MFKQILCDRAAAACIVYSAYIPLNIQLAHRGVSDILFERPQTM